jgi:hypothetical protein
MLAMQGGPLGMAARMGHQVRGGQCYEISAEKLEKKYCFLLAKAQHFYLGIQKIINVSSATFHHHYVLMWS